MAELERWVRELSHRKAWGDLDPDGVARAVREDRVTVQPGFEIWDVKLDDFLGLPDGKVGLYHLEFAHLYGRRYSDLTKTYATLALWHGAEAVAGPAAGYLPRHGGAVSGHLLARCLDNSLPALLAAT